MGMKKNGHIWTFFQKLFRSYIDEFKLKIRWTEVDPRMTPVQKEQAVFHLCESRRGSFKKYLTI